MLVGVVVRTAHIPCMTVHTSHTQKRKNNARLRQQISLLQQELNVHGMYNCAAYKELYDKTLYPLTLYLRFLTMLYSMSPLYSIFSFLVSHMCATHRVIATSSAECTGCPCCQGKRESRACQCWGTRSPAGTSSSDSTAAHATQRGAGRDQQAWCVCGCVMVCESVTV